MKKLLKALIISVIIIVSSSCISMKQYRSEKLFLEARYALEQELARVKGKKISPCWHNPHMFPK
jgi:hypothetical protein